MLTGPVLDLICSAVREGCYLKVAAARAGIIPYTLYLWNERGKREAKHRAELEALGKPTDETLSMFENLYLSLEAAKAEAHYSAETRVCPCAHATELRQFRT